MNISENQLASWSRPVSTTEDQKCKNSISQISAAVKAVFGDKVSVFLQGSYRNNTNVRLDSDVDIVVRYNEVFFSQIFWLSDDQRKDFNRNYSDATYTFSQFKDDIEKLLDKEFFSVHRKNKCIKVDGNSNRVNADVVPCFPFKRFRTASEVEAEGIKLIGDDYSSNDSFPDQHYQNGVSKTNNTNRMYKRIVRILKCMKNNLIDTDTIQKDLVSSFLIESLVFNVPNYQFVSGDYSRSLKNVISVIYNDLGKEERVKEYVEVSDLKYLFRSNDNSKEAREFILKCWQYAGYS